MSIDPTRIEIDLDPRSQRMTGWANHGPHFDVPVISHVEGHLWQGGCANGLVLPTNIMHLVSLYPWEKYTVNHELLSSKEFKAYDADVETIAPQIAPIVAHVLECLKTGPTLVHCQAGLNRSGLIAARVLMHLGHSAADAIAMLRAKRSPAVLCNKSFEGWLLANPIKEGSQ